MEYFCHNMPHRMWPMIHVECLSWPTKLPLMQVKLWSSYSLEWGYLLSIIHTGRDILYIYIYKLERWDGH